ncbi:hypothetical protein IPG36_06270 [bacterium]|nr:MAG: hypothetical protein IPG36_06270 [bacterium]
MVAPRPFSLEGLAREVSCGREWAAARLVAYAPDDDGIYSPEALAHLRAEKGFYAPASARTQFHASASCGGAQLYSAVSDYPHRPLSLGRRDNLSQPQNRQVIGVPRTTVTKLKQLMPPLAPPEYVTVLDLRRETGWACSTIVSRLRKARIQPHEFRAIANGHVINHYLREEAVQKLGVRPRYIPPGGEMLTGTTIANLIGRSYDWILPRVSRSTIQLVARPRLDDSGNIREHYPRWVYLLLERESTLAGQSTAS